MPNLVQMGVDQFWQSLTKLEGLAKAERARLNSDKLRLQAAWSATKRDTNAPRARQHQAILSPLISANSRARIDYASMVAKFNEAVNGAAGVLRQAGLRAQNLAGPELLVLVPVVAVAALGVAWVIYARVHDEASRQGRLIDAASAIIGNPDSTPEQRQQAVNTISALANKKPPGQDPFNLDAILPIVGIVAAIVLLPPLIERLPRARRAYA
jgi:hypothetical protein